MTHHSGSGRKRRTEHVTSSSADRRGQLPADHPLISRQTADDHPPVTLRPSADFQDAHHTWRASTLLAGADARADGRKHAHRLVRRYVEVVDSLAADYPNHPAMLELFAERWEYTGGDRS